MEEIHNKHLYIKLIRPNTMLVRLRVLRNGFRRGFSTTRDSAKLRGLSFKLTSEDASKILMDNRSIFEKTQKTNDLVVVKESPLRQKYIPFHSATVNNLTSSYTGRYGIDRTESMIVPVYNASSKQMTFNTVYYTVTDWYKTSGTTGRCNYPFNMPRMQVYAGFTYPRNYIESVLAKETTGAIHPLTDMMLHDENKKKRIIDPHKMSAAFALEKIANRLHHEEVARAEADIRRVYQCADRVEVNSIDVHLDKAHIEMVSYYLPAFVYTFDCDGENNVKLYKIIDGSTGEFAGDKVYSPLKSFVASSVLGIAVAPFLGGPAAIPILIGRAIIGGILTGSSGGLWAKFSHINKATKEADTNVAEEKRNALFTESEDDVRQRRIAEQFNGSETADEKVHEYHNGNDVSLSEKHTLLGLMPNKKYDQNAIQTAYHIQIKKWHPDTYQGDKNIATQMTARINEAYTVLRAK